MIFTTKNKELAIFGKTLSETKEKLIAFFEAFERGGIRGQHGIIDTFFSKDKKSPLTPELLKNFEEFKKTFNNSFLSAEAIAEQIENVDQRIIDYAKTCKNGEMTTEGFKASMETMSFSAKAGTVALKALSTAGNMLLMWGITQVISLVSKELDEMAHASEYARKRSEELTSKWSEENNFINESISKYEELKNKLDDTSLSAEEVKNIKSDLLSLQDSLTEKYGQEAAGIDLVNGKYGEQIDKLKELSMQKAREYVAENYDNIKEDRKYLTEKFNVNKSLGFKGSIIHPDDYNDVGFDLKKYLDKYDKLDAQIMDMNSPHSMNGTFYLITDGTREEVYDQIVALFHDLNEIKDDPAVNEFKETLSEIIDESFDPAQIQTSKNNVRNYAESEILSNSDTRKAYNDVTEAVDAYNHALANGEGIETAKKNLDSVKEAFHNSTSEIEGADKVFDSIYSGINKTAETAYQIDNAFKNNNSVREYANQLKGLTDADLLKINFNDDVKSTGEQAFQALINAIGLTEEQTQDLIDKLIEFDIIQGTIKPKDYHAFDIFGLKDADDSLTSFGKISESIDTIQNAYQTLSSAIEEYNEHGALSIDTLQSVVALGGNWLDYLVDEQGNLTLDEESLQSLTNARLNDMRIQAINSVIDNVSNIQNEADANLYLASTNYSAAESFSAVAQQSAIAAQNLLEAKLATGEITQRTYDKTVSKMYSDISKINTIFSHVDVGNVSTKGGKLSSGSRSPGGSSSSSSASSSKEIDWFEYRLKELDEAIKLTQTHLDNLTGSKSKNHLTDTLESLYSAKQGDLQKALAMYSGMAQEEFSQIPESLRDMAKNGAIGITDFIGDGNNDVTKAIEDYRKLAEKVGDLESQVAELDATIRKLQVDKFKNIADDYDKLIGITDDYRDKIQSVMDLEEASGNKIGVGFYDSLISHTREQKKLLEEEFNVLNQELQEALSGGKVGLGSDEWKEMRDLIVGVDSDILKCSSDIEDFINAKLESKVREFEEIQDALSGIHNSISDYISLIEQDTVTTSTTELTFTREALAQMGLLRQQYELASEQVGLYNSRMEELKGSYEEGLLSEREYREQLMELISAQNQQAVSMKGSKDAILDLIQNGINEVCDAIDKETDAYQGLIDKRKEALEQEKEEADFQKETAEKQKAVFDLQRQLAALGNASDLESSARRKQLKSDLLNAQTELDEWYAEHNYELQMEALDKEAQAYEESQEEKKNTLQKSLEDEEAALTKYLQEVINNHTSVYEVLQEMGLLYGIRLEESITEPWRIGQDAMGQYAISLGSQSSIFITQLQNVETKIYALQNQADHMAGTLIGAFGVSSDSLVNQIGNVTYALSVDYGYAQNLGNLLSSVLSANYNTSGVVSSIYSIRDAANAAAGAISGMLSGNISTPLQTSSSSKMKFTDWVANNKNQLKMKTSPLPGATGVAGAAKYIKAYAKGGLVTKDRNNPFNPIAEALGEDTMVAVKEGELIVDKDTVERLSPLSKAMDQIGGAFLNNPINNDNIGHKSPLSSMSHYADVVHNSIRNDINVMNEVNINGNVDNSNIKMIQKQIDVSIDQTLKRMLSGIRY